MADEELQEVVLVDEEGREHTFYVFEVVMVDDQKYALLQPADEADDDEEEASAYLFRVESDGEDDRLLVVEDDEEFERVAQALDVFVVDGEEGEAED